MKRIEFLQADGFDLPFGFEQEIAMYALEGTIDLLALRFETCSRRQTLGCEQVVERAFKVSATGSEPTRTGLRRRRFDIREPLAEIVFVWWLKHRGFVRSLALASGEIRYCRDSERLTAIPIDIRFCRFLVLLAALDWK